ncbi:MAG: homocysteine S-methyltransferase family protein [Deltaproteobacteria bacterium]
MQALGRRILIGSGAIGTCLRQAGGAGDEPVELLNLRQPETVKNLHASYRAAGSRILVTNTFAANALVFGDAGVADLCEAAARAGVALARAAGGSDCLVWASIGPLGLGLRIDDYPADALVDIYRRQCGALGGADALLLETFVDLLEARAALEAAVATGLPVIFQIGNAGGGPERWQRVDQLLAEAHRLGVTAVGTNCHHPEEIVRVASYILAHTALPVTASPNAGHPRIERGVVQYAFTPEDFASAALTLAEAGAAMIGGCCGTTPDHIRRMARALGDRAVLPRPQKPIVAGQSPRAPERTGRADNPIRSLMQSNRFVVSVEIRADRTQTLDAIVQGASEVAKAGADLFNVPDNPGATVGRDAMVTAARLQNDLRVPSLCHFSVTQSNLMRLHSTLIGCWDSGLRGLLAITGDAPSMGHLGSLAHRVVDMRSSVELLRLIRGLRDGKIINGEGLADPPDFCAGCAVARPIPPQIKWLKTKIDAGAEFVFSQPVFTLDDYRKLSDALAGLPIRFFPGIMPLVSQRSAAFLAGGRIPGIAVPENVVAAFARYATPADQRRCGLDQALELASGIAAAASGLYLIMPFGKSCYEDAAQIVRHVRSLRGG